MPWYSDGWFGLKRVPRSIINDLGQAEQSLQDFRPAAIEPCVMRTDAGIEKQVLSFNNLHTQDVIQT